MIDQSQLRPLDAPLHTVQVEVASGTGLVLADILTERARQLAQENYSLAHDDTHDFAELARFAAAQALTAAALAPAMQPVLYRAHRDVLLANARAATPPGFAVKPGHIDDAGTQRRHLVIAAALIVAEIERVDRERALWAERAGSEALT